MMLVPLTSAERFISCLTLAVRLVDDFATAAAPVGTITVTLGDGEQGGAQRAGGRLLFIDLPAGTYPLKVTGDCYLPVELTIDTTTLDVSAPESLVRLKPNASYPFPPSATLVRGGVRGNGAPLAGATVHVVPSYPEPSVKARIRQGGAKAGESSIKLANVVGDLQAGDVLQVRDNDRSSYEFVNITAPLPASAAQPYHLASPLGFAHAASTPLHLVQAASPLDTTTDRRGEMVAYFPKTSSWKFLARLTISHAGQQTATSTLVVTEGTCTSAGIVVLAPAQ